MSSAARPQIPLRDSYIPATEPVYPWLSDLVLIQLNSSYCLNMGGYDITSYNPAASYLPDAWDASTNYFVNTHCVREWSNLSLWDQTSTAITGPYAPYARTKRTPVPALNDSMYLRAILNGAGPSSTTSQYYSTIQSSVTAYKPAVTLSPFEAYYMSGFNLSLFTVDAVREPSPLFPCLNSNGLDDVALVVTINPLIMQTFEGENCGWDWNPVLTSDSNWSLGSALPLPSVVLEVASVQTCINVWLPIQLYLISPVDASNNFSADTTSNLSTPNIQTVLTQVRGIFVDASGNPVNASSAYGIEFTVLPPTNQTDPLFKLFPTYESAFVYSPTYGNINSNWDSTGFNRPIYSIEDKIIPIRTTGEAVPYHTSLLFSPQCGVGTWANLSGY